MSNPTHNLVEPVSELGVSLLIRRGKTASRERPVNSEKFLIGTGTACDLQLAGDGLPTLHSILHVDGGDVWIEVMSSSPLAVNHHQTDSCLLRNGDLIEIGPFEFQVRIEAPRQTMSAVREPELSQQAFELPAMLQKSSAEKLVDALDRELQMIERFESRRQMAADALTRAVMTRRRELEHQGHDEFLSRHDEHHSTAVQSQSANVPQMPTHSMADIDQVLDRVQVTLRQLEQRSANLEHREESFAEAAATLMEVQERFARQLEAIQLHLGELSSARRPLRASA